MHAAMSGEGSVVMNAPISDHKVHSTFGKGSITPGPDELLSKLIDAAKREPMRCWGEKTKVMLFGDLSDRISITLNGAQAENVDSFK